MMDEQATVAETMRWLRDRGVAKVEIPFSGGNDEGGTDGFTALDQNGNEVRLPVSSAVLDTVWDRAARTWKPTEWVVRSWEGDFGKDRTLVTRPATPEEIEVTRVQACLEQPIFDRYHSFAGEFQVYGTLTWDVGTGQHELHGQESHEVWEDI